MNGNDFFEAFAGMIRNIIREEMQACLHPSDDWRDQRQSPLGSRRHCLAVRRRAAEGKTDARQVGDRFLLTTDAIAEEMARIGRPKTLGKTETSRAPLTPEDEVRERIQRRLQRGM